MSDLNLNEPPKPTTRDLLHTSLKAAISTAPFVGAPAAEFFSHFITPPLTKRQERWMIKVYESLIILAEKVESCSPENLSQNEVFITTLMGASQIAIRNHQQEKLEALRNTVLNSAQPDSLDEDIQSIYFLIGLILSQERT